MGAIPHYSLDRIRDTASHYEITFRVANPCFGLQLNSTITVLTGIQPKEGDRVLVLFTGKRKLGLYHNAAVELSDGTVTPFAELIGVLI